MAERIDDREAERVRELSNRLVEAQRPIHILDAVHWNRHVRQRFFDAGCRELPEVGSEYYEKRPLRFQPDALREVFLELERDVRARLGEGHPVSRILLRMCREYRGAIALLESRGRADFALRSRELYGSAEDLFHADGPNLASMGELIEETLGTIESQGELVAQERSVSANEAVAVLRARLCRYFREEDVRVEVHVADDIISDAAAGADYLKIRRDATFTPRGIRMLEVHEGWVHLGTTLNGKRQPCCTFLSKGAPSSTVTQEGLAVLMEVLTMSSDPARLRRITDRIEAIRRAEGGATFLDIFELLRTRGYTEDECFTHAARVFRGSAPDLGPFTKDLAYGKGVVLVYTYALASMRRGRLNRLPLLFCGKTAFEDLRTLEELVESGYATPPRHVPDPFRDLEAFASWMSFSSFLTKLDLTRLEERYAPIL